MLADLFLAELEKASPDLPPNRQGVYQLGRELAKRYKEQQETLAVITTLYVKSEHSR